MALDKCVHELFKNLCCKYSIPLNETPLRWREWNTFNSPVPLGELARSDALCTEGEGDDAPDDSLLALVSANHTKMLESVIAVYSVDVSTASDASVLFGDWRDNPNVVGAFCAAYFQMHADLIMAILKPCFSALTNDPENDENLAICCAALHGALAARFKCATQNGWTGWNGRNGRSGAVSHQLLDFLISTDVCIPTVSMGRRHTAMWHLRANRDAQNTKGTRYKNSVSPLLGFVPLMTKRDHGDDARRADNLDLYVKILKLGWPITQMLVVLEEMLIIHGQEHDVIGDFYDATIKELLSCHKSRVLARHCAITRDELHSILYYTVLRDSLRGASTHHTKQIINAIRFPDATLERAAILAAKMHNSALLRHILAVRPQLTLKECAVALTKLDDEHASSDGEGDVLYSLLDVASSGSWMELSMLLNHQKWNRNELSRLLWHLLNHHVDDPDGAAFAQKLLLPPHMLTNADLPHNASTGNHETLKEMIEELYKPGNPGFLAARESFKGAKMPKAR